MRSTTPCSPLAQAKLSVMSALLGAVTPELRGVSIRVDERSVIGRFFFDAKLTDEMRELVDDAETEVIADFLGVASVAFRPEHLPLHQSATIDVAEHWVFLRRELRSPTQP